MASRIMSKKNYSDTIGNQTHDLPACSAVPQPTAPPRAPPSWVLRIKYQFIIAMKEKFNQRMKKET